MRKPRYAGLVEKAIQACVAAMEIYNKPDFRYREEAFSILMLNAWELALKARVLKENRNDAKSIELWEPIKKKDGTRGKRLLPRRNRSGNTMTVGLLRAAELVRQYQAHNIDQRCVDNLHALMEIRDNAVHLHNITPGLSKRVWEVGSAALRNLAHALHHWFDVDLSRFNFYLMPFAFHGPAAVVEGLMQERQPAPTRNLLNYIAERERDHPSDEAADFNVAMQVQLRFVRTTGEDAAQVQLGRGPGAVRVELTEEQRRQLFPWDYRSMTSRLAGRYVNFKQNNDFHALRAQIEGDERLCWVRYLDPDRPRSGKKRFYSPNILSEFDKHYVRI